ncbi:MAG: hypothetical protein U9R68_06405 [Planctomycetota bacterium]|nr:hypothetical protein [Planctomycetota bacterium]
MAADLTQTFMGKHGEKVALGVAVLIFIGAVAWFVVMREPHGGLLSDVNGLVDRLQKKTQQEVTLEEAISPEEQTVLGIGRKGMTVPDLRDAFEGLAPTYKVARKTVPPIYRPQVVVRGPEQQFAPQEVMPVEQVRVAVGYGVTDALDVPDQQATLRTADATYNDIVWAGVVGKFDLTRQVEIYQKPYLADGRTAPLSRQSPITITRVEVRRRQVKPDGTMTEWATVTPAVPTDVAAALPSYPDDNKNRATVGKWYQGLTGAQAQIRRLPFYNILSLGVGQTVQALAGEVQGVAQPDLSRFAAEAEKTPEPAKEEAGATPGTGAEAAPAKPAPPSDTGGRSPWEGIAGPEERPSERPAEATEPAEREHVYATLWVNDATVEPGKTYQYQMRTAVLNPVWSLTYVQPKEDRWKLEFLGPWSEPTEPVTVPKLVEFYFVGTFGRRINLELHKWIHGQWIIIPSAPTRIGGPVVYTKRRARLTVPGTGETVEQDVEMAPGAFLVDIIRQFPYQPQGRNRPIPTNVLVYADEQGNLHRRIQWADQERERKDRMERKQAAAAAPTGRAKRKR